MAISHKSLYSTWLILIFQVMCFIKASEEKNKQLLVKQTNNKQNRINTLCYCSSFITVAGNNRKQHKDEKDYLAYNSRICSITVGKSKQKLNASYPESKAKKITLDPWYFLTVYALVVCFVLFF